ncbi:hypothetical protein ACIBF1_36070 [Spirillospora sp. NPDC050679]
MRVLLCALLAATLAGCGGERMCTLLGAESGVDFFVDPALLKKATRIRTCAAEVCRDLKPDPADPLMDSGQYRYFVIYKAATREQRMPVTIRITGRSGTLFESSSTVVLEDYRPNGEGCPPLVHVAKVTAAPSGLRQAPWGR